MKRDTEQIERYLRGIEAPQCECCQHRHESRQQILDEIGKRLILSAEARPWKCAAAIGLIGAGLVIVAAAMVGVQSHKHPSLNEAPEADYLASRQDDQNQSVASVAEDNRPSPDQAVRLLQDLPLLKQQGDRESVTVRKISVNGRLGSRTVTYEYRLPDNRTVYVAQPDPNAGTPQDNR